MSEPEAADLHAVDVTPPPAPPSSAGGGPADDEQIRKIYAKDLRAGETVHTVFKVEARERHTSRSGKVWLAVTLVDRTGVVDARVFENVDAAEAAFAAGDYLLVKGRVGTFHGRMQLIVDRLERLDPEPIDPKEFSYVAPPPAAKASHTDAPKRPLADAGEAARDDGAFSHRQTRQRVLRLLDNPVFAQAVDFLLRQLDAHIDERIAARLGQPPPGADTEQQPSVDRPERERHERKGKGGRSSEHRGATPATGAAAGHHPGPRAGAKAEPKRDPSLPAGLAFKPLELLMPAPTATATPEGSNGVAAVEGAPASAARDDS